MKKYNNDSLRVSDWTNEKLETTLEALKQENTMAGASMRETLQMFDIENELDNREEN